MGTAVDCAVNFLNVFFVNLCHQQSWPRLLSGYCLLHVFRHRSSTILQLTEYSWHMCSWYNTVCTIQLAHVQLAQYSWHNTVGTCTVSTIQLAHINLAQYSWHIYSWHSTVGTWTVFTAKEQTLHHSAVTWSVDYTDSSYSLF